LKKAEKHAREDPQLVCKRGLRQVALKDNILGFFVLKTLLFHHTEWVLRNGESEI